jgi:putrescine aminotransferase
LADAAARQIRELSYYSSFFKATHPTAIDLAEQLVRLTPSTLNHAFFANSGSDANDTALRMVRWFWNLQGKPERQVVIACEYAYHGSTVAAAALSGIPFMHEQGGTLPDIVHIPPAYQFLHGRDLNEKEFGLRAAGWLEQAILEVGSERVAAFFVEPIQGAGGGKMPPPNYLPEVEKICRKYGVLLVTDEVVTGCGRTGQWWGSETLGPIQPDFMCVAKGVTSGYFPLSAVMVGDRVAETFIREGGEFHHGFTYSGHPVGCAVALENLRILESEGIIERVRTELAPYFAERLAGLASSPVVGEVRNVGLIGAVEIVADRETLEPIEDAEATCEKIREFGFEEGIIVRPIESTVLIAPPLVINREQIDFLFDGLTKALKKFEPLVMPLPNK